MEKTCENVKHEPWPFWHESPSKSQPTATLQGSSEYIYDVSYRSYRKFTYNFKKRPEKRAQTDPAEYQDLDAAERLRQLYEVGAVNTKASGFSLQNVNVHVVI